MPGWCELAICRLSPRISGLFLALLALVPSTRCLDAADVSFATQIQPLLEKHCTECHGKEKQKADLRLDLRPHAFKGGSGGPVIVPGDSGKSALV